MGAMLNNAFSITLSRQSEEALPFAYTTQRSSMQKLANAPARRSLRIAKVCVLRKCESADIITSLWLCKTRA